MKLVVFTASIGDTDSVKAPDAAFSNVEYVAFVPPGVSVPKPWQSVAVLSPQGKHVETARRLKIQAHRTVPDADYSLWIDAAFELQCNPWGLLDYLGPRSSVMAFEHPDRTNVVQEANELARLHMVPHEVTQAQLRTMGQFPNIQQQLTATGFLLRRHLPTVTLFNEAWHRAFKGGGHTRDQMSVDYAAYLQCMPIGYFPGNYRSNGFAKWHRHRQ